jgi:iron complex transport system substrate-binding protein
MARRIAGRAAAAVVPAVLIVLGVVVFAATGGTTRLSLLGARPFHATQVVGEDFPKRLIDPFGTPQTLAAPPNRILSGVLASDEILTILVPSERLAGVTHLVDEPGLSEVAKLLPPDLPRIHADAETMLALQPDLVVLASYTRATTVRLLASAGVPVLRFQRYRSFADIMNSVRMLAAAVGADDNGARLVDDMQQRIAGMEERTQGLARPRVLYYGGGGYSVGEDTLIDAMITLAGGHNVARDVGLQGQGRLSLEAAVSLRPEVILVSEWEQGTGDDRAAAFLHHPVWAEVPAVQKGRVHGIKGAWLSSVSHYSVKALEAIARVLHPEAFAL